MPICRAKCSRCYNSVQIPLILRDNFFKWLRFTINPEEVGELATGGVGVAVHGTVPFWIEKSGQTAGRARWF